MSAEVCEHGVPLADYCRTCEQAMPGDDIDAGKARDIATAYRNLIDPMSGRIDNWSQR